MQDNQGYFSLNQDNLNLIKAVFEGKIKVIDLKLKNLEKLEAEKQRYAEILQAISSLIESG